MSAEIWTITPERLELHRLWNLTDGREGERLVVPRGADLRGSDLHSANLHGADLRFANLRGSDLRGSDLHFADLRGSDLRGSDLRSANLHGADLRFADLRGSDLRGSDLRSANLHGADLRGADLRGSDLHGSDLHGADLRGADLHGADLHDGKLFRISPRIALEFAHDWQLVIYNSDNGLLVHCGCRKFPSPEAARGHWNKHENQQRRDVVIPALDALLSIAKAQGWDTTPRLSGNVATEQAT